MILPCRAACRRARRDRDRRWRRGFDLVLDCRGTSPLRKESERRRGTVRVALRRTCLRSDVRRVARVDENLVVHGRSRSDVVHRRRRTRAPVVPIEDARQPREENDASIAEHSMQK